MVTERMVSLTEASSMGRNKLGQAECHSEFKCMHPEVWVPAPTRHPGWQVWVFDDRRVLLREMPD